MKLWFKKISAVLITLLTLGMYIPPTYLDANAEGEKDDSFPADEELQGVDSAFSEIEEIESDLDGIEDDDSTDIDVSDHYVQMFTEQAREQTFNKLGPRIANKVEDDFMMDVFPSMEEVISTILDELDEDEFTYLEIEEQKASVKGEKIFNIYDHQAKEDVARFHVRRDLKPKDGYWFNFHYHLRDDNFEEHHDLGNIYWDKNTPPKWMSS